ncbi:MAG: phosphoadenosine phosphosulfate reductase family protein [Methanosarcinaceae archaeon]|nr:phosphoadenosine phosphosulfate reductase family protein [Methanosarcinaceae archaeon]
MPPKNRAKQLVPQKPVQKTPVKTGARKIYSKPREKKYSISQSKRVTYEKDYIFWCHECNVPLIGQHCCTCDKEGVRIDLSQPADIRFCSPYEREILVKHIRSAYGCDPIGERVVLLNKIPGEDKTDEVIVDGMLLGILRFDLSTLDYRFDISADGAKILMEYTDRKTVFLKRTKSHLSGKKISPDLIEGYSDDIKKGDDVLVISGNLTGSGTSYLDRADFVSAKDAVLKVKKIDSKKAALNQRIPGIGDVINANIKYIRLLGKNAMNTISGIANQKAYKNVPVHVSFSGGKDSLVVLDLACSAIKNRPVKAFFINTGLEFPETVAFARDYCRQKDIDLVEEDAGNAFWDHIDKFGPPAKDFRWCCKVCKLAPANNIIEECTKSGHVCLTIDGKRKYESFSRGRIAPSEMNPFIPNQLNVFPIRDWRALEVWMYIHWRKLDYNPLYDMGFERVGCYLCPAALSAEYQRMGEIHPEMYEKWNLYLLKWAHEHGLSDEFVNHGFWRWKELPPKMLKLAGNSGISITPANLQEPFRIRLTSGISPCRAGGFTVEGIVEGVLVTDARDIMNIIGDTVFSDDLGMLLVKTDRGSVKMFSSGSILVTAQTEDEAITLFKDVAKQLMSVNKCTNCGVCQKICPVGAIDIQSHENGHIRLQISESCIRCGKCTEACVVVKYFDKLIPGFTTEHRRN